MAQTPLVYLSGVSKAYNNNVVLRQADLVIPQGSFIFLLGHTGAGKSTLLKMISGEVRPTKGKIYVKGQDIARWSGSKKATWRRCIGYVFQEDRLLTYRTVYENVALPLEIHECSRRQIKDKVISILKVLGIGSKAYAYPDELSGGEKQRVSLARAIVTNPELIIADEPTAQLDPITAQEIFTLLSSLNQSAGISVIMATHEWELVSKTNYPSYVVRDGLLMPWEGSI